MVGPLLSELKVKMLLFFKYNYFLKRKTAITVFFDSYRKGKYRTFNIETEPGADPGFVVRGGVSRRGVWGPLKVPSWSKAEPW